MVEVVESGLVVPCKETPKHGIWLSNLDLTLGVRDHTPTIYFYRPNYHNRQPDFFAVETLKAALAKALVHFYPLAGRLEVGKDGRIEINCTGEGALFVVARSESSVDGFGDFAPSPEMRQLLVPTAESAEPPAILLMVQVTFFKGGEVILGIALHHTALDGHSALHFVKVWSEIARGITDVSIPPVFDHTPLRARSPPTVTVDHTEYKPNHTINASTPPNATPPPFLSVILKLSKNHLSLLKSDSYNSSNKKPLSTFRAVIAHIWRCACIARNLSTDKVTRLYVVADARNRLRPPLPAGYFGNAICRASAVATAGEVVSSPLEFGGRKISEAADRVDDEYVRSLIDVMEMGNDESGWRLLGTDLFIISWLGMPIYDADFGWGEPEFMGRANMFCGGFGYVVNDPGNDGGVSVVMSMETENMEGFKKAFYGGVLEGVV